MKTSLSSDKMWRGCGALLVCVSWCVAAAAGCDEKKPSAGQLQGGDEPAAGADGARGAGDEPAHKAVESASDPAKPSSPASQQQKSAVVRSGMATTFDLLDNRHLAHFEDGGLLLDLGYGSGLKYVQGRWKNPWYGGQELGAERFAYPQGVGATLRFPLGPGESGKTGEDWVVRARLMPVGDQRCDVFLNAPGRQEAKIGSLVLKEGWHNYVIKLPAGLELGQEHTLRFHFSKSREVSGVGTSAAAFDWVHVGRGLSEEGDVGRQRAAFDVGKGAIVLKGGQQVSYYLTLGEATSFVADVVSGQGVVVVQADGGSAQRFEIKGSGAAVDLKGFANQAVRLTVAASGDAGVVLGSPALVVPAPKEVASGAPPQYVVVWLIDTLRSDHLPMYNSKTEVQTPNLDAFTRESALFVRSTVQGNSSLPSSASIFSGSYPPTHGVVRESARLSADATVLGEGLKRAKWSAGLFSSNGYVSQKWGFARGFDTEFNPIRDSQPSDAEYLWPKAFEWLKKQVESDPKQPVLVYLNTSDPHVPYDPPKEQLSLYHQGDKVGRINPRGTGELLHDMAKGGITLTHAEIAYMRALYKGEITYNDLWFGKMLAQLDELGIRDKTMIIVTSDHGEEFGEYGRFGHGVSANQELVDVPLIIGYRPWTSGGRRVEAAVEVLDIYPTLLDVAGVGQEAWGSNVQGKSLVKHVKGEAASHADVGFAYHNDFLRSARVHDLKYQLFQGDKDPLYVVQYQPTKYADYTKPAAMDATDVSTVRPIARRQMRDAMAFQVAFDASWQRSKDGSPNNHSASRAQSLDGAW